MNKLKLEIYITVYCIWYYITVRKIMDIISLKHFFFTVNICVYVFLLKQSFIFTIYIHTYYIMSKLDDI